MPVTLLQGENLRLYRRFRIEPHPSLNLILGANASGKTSLLEALFVAARGRSFRAPNLAELCRRQAPGWHLFMQVAARESEHRIGLGWSRSGSELHLDEHRHARMVDVLRCAPMQIIDPGAHRLLDEGPAYRRSFVDWGVFHVEQRFLEIWRRYQRALRQRNRALREAQPARAVQSWDQELADSGERLNELRQAHVNALMPALRQWAGLLLETDAIGCDWHAGWNRQASLLDTLRDNLEGHRRQGTTVQGPHRAELRLNLDMQRARGFISRGQQKLLIAGIVLAQAELLAAAGCPVPVLLLDDFTAELSPEFQDRLAKALIRYPGQKFITAFEMPAGFESGDPPLAMFHVEHGTAHEAHRTH